MKFFIKEPNLLYFINMPWIPEPSEKWWLGYSYTINSIIGAGILAIPWGYANCGWLIGILIQVLVLGISFSASYLLLSTWSRVEIIAQIKESGGSTIQVPLTHLFRSPKIESFIPKTDSIIIKDRTPKILDRKFDLNEMVTLTMGKKYSYIVISAFILSSYPTLVAYCSVFSKSMASNVPLFGYTCNIYDENSFFGQCKLVYWGYLSIFSTIMIILSYFHLSEQRWIQLLLSCFRFTVFTIMIITSLFALATNTNLESPGPNNSSPALADFSKFGSLFFIIIFASLFENLIPTTTGFVKNKSKDLPKIINLSCISFNILYITVGLILSFSIENPEEMVSLNWRNYTAGNSLNDRPGWTYIITYIVIILPAMDISSSFPIISSNFADNLMSITYGHENVDKVSQVIFI